MKINPLNSSGISSLKRTSDAVASRGAKEGGRTPPGGEDRVTLSDEARFLQELRELGGGLGTTRPEVVEAARADLEAGRIGTEEDYERAIEALFMEL